MRAFVFARRFFASGAPYHHEFIPPKYDEGVLTLGLAAFDYCRILLYAWIGVNVINHSISFIAFWKNKRKFVNNPDYRFISLEIYKKFQEEKKKVMNMNI